jgi:hypothetical protein
MDPETAVKAYRQVLRDMAGAYVLMIAVLARLPIPMLLPGLDEQRANPSLVIRSLDKAWELAGYEFLEPRGNEHVRNMIGTWLAAHEVCTLAEAYGPAPWRLRGIGAAMRACEAEAEWLDRYLTWIKNPEAPQP